MDKHYWNIFSKELQILTITITAILLIIIYIVIKSSNIISAVFTAIAAVIALFAYLQSIKTRMNSSFDAIFTQLLASLHSFFYTDYVKKTRLKQGNIVSVGNISIGIDPDLNVFLNFCTFYQTYFKRKGDTFSVQEISQIWKAYSNALLYESDFLICFKYLYHTIDTVSKFSLDEKTKRQYIGIIQSQLNLDVLFCYLINQIVMADDKENEFTHTLKDYDFFKDLYEDGDRYKTLAINSIPDNINNFFYENTENIPCHDRPFLSCQ